MRWLTDGYDPCSGGLVAIQRIPVRHYRARDPVQVQTRCAIRAATAYATNAANRHWHWADWRREICRDQDPALFRWGCGEPLPERTIRNHLTPKFPRPGSERAFQIENAIRRISPAVPRLVQHLLYRSGLVYLRDRLRPREPETFRPAPLPADVAERIRRYMNAIEEHPSLDRTPLPVQDREHHLAAIDRTPSNA
jgi:hypothetical protein